MKKLNTIIYLSAIVLTMACTSSNDIDEIVEEADALYVETSAMLGDANAQTKVTRAHWNDDNQFAWDNSSNEMVVVVKETATGNIIPWGTNKSSSARVKIVTGLEDVVSVASITSNSGILKNEIQKITIGQSPVYFLSPILPDANGSSVDVDGIVTLALPNDFVHDGTPSLADFKKYTYIKAESTVTEIGRAQIQTAPAHFTGLPAVIRFAVTNDRGDKVKVTGISVNVAGNVTGGFPKTVTWTPGESSNPSLAISTILYKTLQASMGTAGYVLSAKGTEGVSANFYAFTFPASFAGATLTLNGKDSSNHTFSYSCDIPAKVFESGKIYTWNITLADDFMNLSFFDHEEDIFQW